jgi:hypothetical protein
MTEPEEWLADTWRQIEEIAREQRGRVILSPAGCMALLAERKRLMDASRLSDDGTE